ncbi:MAG: hypothetical protein AAFP22_12045 [Planctomycetota bacterium]
MTRTKSAIAAALAAALLASCGGGDAPSESNDPTASADSPAAHVADALTLSAASARGTFEVDVVHAGGPIPLNEAFDVELFVRGADGTPFDGGDAIGLDARMQAHGHGMLRDVELVQAAPGRWRAEGLLFHMVGAWQFHVDVRRGAYVERAQIDYELEH